ncbi:hypothetical protein [Halpernia sp.]|uniref:hypothetical protein n=1 Tax=Halpernia sp. TaxID=2782209 RepID=UPI003A9388FF
MKHFKILYFIIFFSSFLQAQVGINTSSPDASASLDVQFKTDSPKGFLAPRMTTAQRNSIVNPAESLLVFDTDIKAFFYYNTATSAWVKISSDLVDGRKNYRLIKTESDFAPELLAGGGNSYKLDSNTYYEINGKIDLAKSIDLNDAYISGLDANEDILSFPTGTIFKGNTGGSIRNITLIGAKAFDIVGPGISSNSSLLVQNTITLGMTTAVGNISGFGLYFGNINQFVGNANGLTYSNIGNLLLSNQAWLASNSGTFEKFTGSFGLIEKGSGFSTVDGSDIALDVSTTGLNVGTGILEGTVFSGTTSSPTGIIKGYAAALTYPGYNFSNVWSVNAPGIPRESDDIATGDINLNAAVGSGILTTFSGTGSGSRVKVNGTTTSNNLFRFTKDGDNRITYRGNKKRYFQVAASVSYQATDDLTLILYIAKNGVVLTETKVYGRGATGFFTSAGILALPIVGTVELKKDDYVEVWAERYSNAGNMQTLSLNLIAK